jgi:hypothetical protein
MSTSRAGALSRPESTGVPEHSTPLHALAMARRRSEEPGPVAVERALGLLRLDKGREPRQVMEVIMPSLSNSLEQRRHRSAARRCRRHRWRFPKPCPDSIFGILVYL